MSLERAGARLVRFDFSGLNEIYGLFLQGGVAAPELAAFIRQELPEIVPTLDPNVAARLRTAEELPAWKYIHRLDLIKRLSVSAATELQGIDALLTPTVTLTPPAVDSLDEPGAYATAKHAGLA